MTTQDTNGSAPNAGAAEKTDDTNKETVQTNVDPVKVELESERRKFEDARLAWESEKATLVEQASKTKEVEIKTKFDVDEILDDPFAFFKEHGADDDKVFELAQNIFFLKYPDKAPPSFDLERTKRKMERQLKKMEDSTKDVEKRVEETLTQKQQTEYNKRIEAEFQTASEFIKTPEAVDTYPCTAAFFGEDTEDYKGALINCAGNVAKELKRVPTTKEVAEALEKWLETRYTRFKPKQAEKKIAADLEKAADKTTGSVTLSNEDNRVERRKPVTAEERFNRGLKALENREILEKSK